MKRWSLPVVIVLLVIFCIVPISWKETIGYPNWTEWWAFGTFLVTAAAALVAFREYRKHEEDSRQEAAQREKDYVQQVRPYVTARITFERSVHFLELKNIGRTPAKNISLKVDPRLIDMCNSDQTVHSFLEYAVVTPFAFLAPGQRLIFFVCSGREAAQAYREGKDLSFFGHIVYSNLDGIEFTDEYNMDIADYADTIKEEDAAERIEKALRKQNSPIEQNAKTRLKQMDYLNSALSKMANQTFNCAKS